MLELKNVYFKYEKAKNYALTDINYIFEKNKLYAVTGRSGAGKSTLISLIAGLDKPYSGEIIYNGKNIQKTNLSLYRAKNIGVVFQNHNLLLKSTVLDNVLMGLYLSGEKNPSKKEACGILEKLGINMEKSYRTILKLSGGEQQRVAIARALAGNPDIITADEPTGNLDGINTEIIMDILANLAKNNQKCVIVSTHSKEAAAYADYTVNIDEGKIITI